jgi:transposase
VTEQERDLVVEALAAEDRAGIQQRLRTILLLEQGLEPDAVAAEMGINRASVYNWAQDWRQGGLAGLATPRGGPGTPLLDATAERLLRTCLATPPAAYGHTSARWTLPLMRAELLKGGYTVSASTVGLKARELGWSRKQIPGATERDEKPSQGNGMA